MLYLELRVQSRNVAFIYVFVFKTNQEIVLDCNLICCNLLWYDIWIISTGTLHGLPAATLLQCPRRSQKKFFEKQDVPEKKEKKHKKDKDEDEGKGKTKKNKKDKDDAEEETAPKRARKTKA